MPAVARAADEMDPEVGKLVAATLGIDMHNHIDVPLAAADLPGPEVDLASEMKRSGLSAICMTFAVDYQPIRKPGDAYDRFVNGLTATDALLTRNKMRRALNLKDLQTAHDEGQPIVVQSIEGGHFLEGKLERVEEAYRRGLRHFGLLHDHDAEPPLGDIYTVPAHLGGLTEFGGKVIKECERLGIVIDLAHANMETVTAALKIVTKPVLITHTGLDTQLGKNPRMADMMKPRLIGKEQAKVVAEAGGVIGVWTHLADSPEDYASNVRALVDVIGVDHVGIGTDTKLTPPPGGGARRGGGTNQAWPDQKAGFYHAVVAAMLKSGFTAEEIGKIGGGNFCRVFDAGTAGHS
ncbi:membrane dipeptidase [Luteolibacter sp. Y139]|uniref:Membrane dipeptidase n=2 Tax=Luteolibacter soli TaxID=3135280 RepID=A0ABU9AQS7_9BACT